jgi:hypothetical protein
LTLPTRCDQDALSLDGGTVMLSASVYVVVFRVLHVLGGIAWAGAVFTTVIFLQPTAKAIGPAAGPFMRELLGARRLIDWVLALAWTTIIAGGFLYWHDLQLAGGLGDFLGTSFGLWLTIGAVAALVAVGIGMIATRPALKRSLALGGQIAQAGDSPPPELVQELQATQARSRTLAKWNLGFVALAAFAMSTARYW